MALFIQDPDEILQASIQELQRTTNITRYSAGSKAQAILLALNKQYRAGIRLFEIGTALSFVYGATGQYLDFIGQLFGIQRNQAKRAFSDKVSRNFKFYTAANTFGDINGGEPILARKGRKVYSGADVNGNVLNYFVSEDTYLPSNTNTAYVTIEAASPGQSFSIGSNILTNHDVTEYVDFQNKSLFCTNVGSIENGSDIEDDEHYRFRIINNRLTGEAGNATAVRLAALSIPGVADVLELPYNRGIGTFDLIIQSTTGDVGSDLIQAVQAVVDNIAVSNGISALVRAPVMIGIQLFLTINYRRSVQQVQMEEAEQAYLSNYRQFLIAKPIGYSLVINEMVPLFPLYDGVQSVGTPNKPFDALYIFRSSKITPTQRVKNTLLKDYGTRFDEKLVPEYSTTSPLVIKRVLV